MQTASSARAAILAPFFSSSKMMVFAAVLAMILYGQNINAERAFVLAAMYNAARLTINLFVPFAITFLAESKTTLRRVQVEF